MDLLLRGFSVLGAIFTFFLTVSMVLSYRRERVMRPIQLLLSAMLSLVLLPALVLLSGARLNLLVAVALFLLGLLLGALRGLTVKIYPKAGQVVGKPSMFSTFLYGGSIALAMLANALGSSLLASLGLVPLFMTTGSQVAMHSVCLLRRLFIRPMAVTPG
jgi:hypothetical protein